MVPHLCQIVARGSAPQQPLRYSCLQSAPQLGEACCFRHHLTRDPQYHRANQPHLLMCPHHPARMWGLAIAANDASQGTAAAKPGARAHLMNDQVELGVLHSQARLQRTSTRGARKQEALGQPWASRQMVSVE